MRTAEPAFHVFEHEGWERSAERYHDSFGPLTAQAIVPLLDAAGVRAGTRVLDVASGPGYVSAAAAGRGAVPIGIDFSARMVALARRSYPALEFREGDAQALPFPDEAFDALVMNFGLLHLGAPEQAIGEARRVLRSGGRFAFTVWAQPQEALGFRIVLDAIRRHGNPNVPLPPGPPFFQFSDPVETERVLREAAFTGLRIDSVPQIWRLPSGRALFEAFHEGTARTGGLLRAQMPADLERIRDTVETAAKRFERGGGIEVPMPAMLAAGEKY